MEEIVNPSNMQNKIEKIIPGLKNTRITYKDIASGTRTKLLVNNLKLPVCLILFSLKYVSTFSFTESKNGLCLLLKLIFDMGYYLMLIYSKTLKSLYSF